MRCIASFGFSALAPRVSVIVIICFFVAVGFSTAGRPGTCIAAAESRAGTNTTVFLFNTSPSQTYSVVKNALFLALVNSSQDGVTLYTDDAAPGDQYVITQTGSPPQPPTAPLGITAQGDDVGCGYVQWNANPENDVDFYRVYYGTSSVASGAAAYDDSVDVGGATGTNICGLADGTYFFSVRAHNTAGLLSVFSLEVSASVSNGNTQPPPPPMVVTATDGGPGILDIAWMPSSSPDVVGYVVGFGTRSVQSGDTTAYYTTLDVGDVASYRVGGLAGGTYYVAVRSKNYAGATGAWSAEQSADIAPTAVFITAFDADAGARGVELSWRITADEAVKGYHVLRSRENDTHEVVLNDGQLIDPQRSSWTDEDVAPLTTYSYTLVAVAERGAEYRSGSRIVTTPALELALKQNVPNPFNPSTTIGFVVPTASRVRLSVYDVKGSLVATLVDAYVSAGRMEVTWDGATDAGGRVGSGVYFCRLIAGNKSMTMKMLLLK